ncbi:unnamed protein product [Alternaria alternata]
MASSIKFARFKNATLELFEAPIESTDYIAFSHVWGNWAWRSTDGIPYEIKASEEKAHFIANDLPALVGDGAFWMDTLTVDQRNPAEVSEIVDKIPTIFRMAKKTIAVREYPVSGWLPSQHLPSPTTLGDFLKLVGQRVPENSKVSSQHVHVTSVVHIEEFECEGSPDFVIALLEACLRNFQGQWQESHQGGELSKYGPYPSVNWALDSLDALRCGWLHTDPEHAIRVYENNDQSWIRIGPGLEYEEDDLLLGLRSLDETEQGARTDETNNVASLFVQARKILDNMWCAHDPHYISASQKADWATFKQQMQDELWSHIMRFTNDLPVDRTTNAYDAWPFVELVSIGGPFAVLERNIIQADTPGQDDIDLIAETSIEDPSSIDKNEFEQTEEVRRLDA